jgi:hypothetical protein
MYAAASGNETFMQIFIFQNLPSLLLLPLLTKTTIHATLRIFQKRPCANA